MFGVKAYPSAHDPQWTLNTYRSTLFPFTISIQNDCYIIKPWPHEAKGWNMVPSLKTCRIVSLNRRFLPVLGGVVLRVFKEPLVLVLWTSQNERITGFTSLEKNKNRIKEPLVLVISKTSKSWWFSWRNRQRTSFESHNHIPKPIILKEIGNWRASGYIHCWYTPMGICPQFQEPPNTGFYKKFMTSLKIARVCICFEQEDGIWVLR